LEIVLRLGIQAPVLFQASIETGRFTQVNTAHVIGSEAAARYPAASSAHQTELPPEPALGFAIDQMPADDPSTNNALPPPVAVEGLGGAVAPSCPSGVEPAPPSSELGDSDGFISQPKTIRDEWAGSPSNKRSE
jgi:hypothetical protein